VFDLSRLRRGRAASHGAAGDGPHHAPWRG
jgi:hypothetical protein